MIKKLRIRLIAVSMASLFVVLAVIVTALNIFNYHKIVRDSDSILTVLVKNDGKFPKTTGRAGIASYVSIAGLDINGSLLMADNDEPDDDKTDDDSDDKDDDNSDDDTDKNDTDDNDDDDSTVTTGVPTSTYRQDTAPAATTNPAASSNRPAESSPAVRYDNFNDLFKAGPGFDPLNSLETPFESRYFSVKYDSEGNISGTDVSRIAAINDSTARAMADQVITRNKTSGFLGRYRYRIAVLPNGTRLVAFLDTARNMSSFYNTL